jgi:hypothetical protein
LIFCLFLVGPAKAADLGGLLDSVVDTYGGPSAAARMEAFRVEAAVDARPQGGIGRVVRDFEAPDRYRVEIAYPQGTEVRILNGTAAWRGDDTRLQRVEGPPKLAMIYQLLRATIPWVFVHHRKLFEDRGTGRRDGVELRRVGLPWAMDLDLTFWVDPVNRRVPWVEGLIRTAQGPIAFATRYEDFRRIDGVLVPFAEENYAGDQHTGTTRVRSVVFAPAHLGPFDPTRLGQ